MEKVPRAATVVVDEAYHHFVEAPGYRSTLEILDRFPNLVVARTFSKVHAPWLRHHVQGKRRRAPGARLELQLLPGITDAFDVPLGPAAETADAASRVLRWHVEGEPSGS